MTSEQQSPSGFSAEIASFTYMTQVSHTRSNQLFKPFDTHTPRLEETPQHEQLELALRDLVIRNFDNLDQIHDLPLSQEIDVASTAFSAEVIRRSLSWLAFDEYVKSEAEKVRTLLEGKEIVARSGFIDVNGTVSLHGPGEVTGEFAGYNVHLGSLKLVDGRNRYGVGIWTNEYDSGETKTKQQGTITEIS